MATGRGSAGYSRLVGVLKVVLPLTALVLLSLVFLTARTIDPTQAIEQAEIDVEDRARDPRLSGARFAGVTVDGAAMTIEAATARSDPTGAMRLRVTGLSLLVEGADGATFTARAAEGMLDRGLGRFEMEGGLEITASPGYRLTTQRLSGLLDSTRLVAPMTVSGQAPAGEFTAGRMDMAAIAAPDSPSGTGYRLVFGGGVRLYYLPVE